MFEKLRGYRNIAWDFDDTLIGHHYSHDMWEFILTNPYEQSHHLVTFRSGGYQDYIDSDLDIQGSSLRLSNFATVDCAPHEMWMHHNKRRAAGLEGGPDSDEDTDPYLYWKGWVCSQRGFPVLIDDATDNVLPGCLKYGVHLIHPDEIL